MTSPSDSMDADSNSKQRELDLVERKNLDERALKERELALSEKQLEQERQLKEQEFQIQRRQLAIGRWSGPVAVAVIAGLLGIIGTFFSASQNRELERRKQEGTLVLEAIRTGASGKERERQAAANLVFLADAGLITLGGDQLKKLREHAGDATPSLPPAAAVQPGGERIPESTRNRIQRSFTDFADYFAKIGATKRPRVGVDLVPPDIPAVAYYDPDKRTVFVDAKYLSDEQLPLREYAHAMLYDDVKFRAVDYDRTWAYVAIESGLASYFASSFANNPRIPGTDPGESLVNSRKVPELKPGPMANYDGMVVWGAIFWELRGTLPPSVADRVLYAAWTALTASEIKANDHLIFVRHVLEADARLEQGRHSDAIKVVLRRRGVSI